jgi:uncharacterized membrane protein YdjX (TVP38/TMEM64 family)
MVGSVALLLVGLARGWLDQGTIGRLVSEPSWASFGTYVVIVLGMQLLWCPRMWGLLAAGAIFGPWLGIVVSLVPDTLSACLCHAMARGGGHRWAAARLERHARAKAVLRLLADRRGGMTVFLLRVLPIHYTAVSYAAGLAGVGWPEFIAGTLLGALPGTLLYNLMGGAARHSSLPLLVASGLAVIVVTVAGALGARRLWQSDRAGRAHDPGQPNDGGAEGN